MRTRGWRHVLWCTAAGAVMASGAGAVQEAPAAAGQAVTRKVYVAATDGKGAAATDLVPEDLVVKEDGRERPVISVAPADDRMQIAMLVDDSGPGIQHVRQGVAGFLRIVQYQAEVAIVSTAAQNRLLVDFTSDPAVLLGAVNHLTTRTTTGGYLLDALHEWAGVFARSEAVRPVIVVLALEGPEFSSLAAARVLEALRRSRAVVYALSVGRPTMKTMTSWNQRPTDSVHEALDEGLARHTVLAEAPRRSGGRLQQIGQASGIPAQLARMAYELRGQLAVTYAGAPHRAERLEIGTRRRGVKVHGPKQVP